MENLRLYFATYNVGTNTPDQDLHELLALSHNWKNDKLLPDLYVVSLQEVKAKPQNMLLDALFDDPWTKAICNLLEIRDYVKVKTIRLQGLILSVYCLRKHLLNVREIESDYTRTGLSGMWGNKGAVSIRLSAYGCSLCFINSHLTAHDDGLENRIEDYNNIIKDQEFHVDEHTEIFFHDYVFWMGDLNFRLDEDYDRSPEEIERTIKAGDLAGLFQYDQLRIVMSSGQAFSELQEATPTFPPTFKYDVGSSNYDYKRRPAWTDRILYKVNSNNYENVTLKAEQKSYKCHGHYVLSDHKPVTADFMIKVPEISLRDTTKYRAAQVFADVCEAAVEFEKIATWYLDEENEAVYKITKEIAKNKDDWIGVFKENFSSLDDYILYEYINKSSSPLAETRSSHHSREIRRPMKYTITFPDLNLRSTQTKVRLIYFSLTEDEVQTILGISDPIPLAKKESD